jgi:hypothetical protein
VKVGTESARRANRRFPKAEIMVEEESPPPDPPEAQAVDSFFLAVADGDGSGAAAALRRVGKLSGFPLSFLADTLGRSGLLAHSYMLGPKGDSNGCVSIKDYGQFLRAFQNGEIKRLVVVVSLKGAVSASRRSTSQS